MDNDPLSTPPAPTIAQQRSALRGKIVELDSQLTAAARLEEKTFRRVNRAWNAYLKARKRANALGMKYRKTKVALESLRSESGK
jgi:hypothetical protein